MAQETNDTILWIPAASMAGITTAAAAIGSQQTGGPDTPGDYRIVRGTLHTGTATIAVAAALASGQWNVVPGANSGEIDFSFSEYGALNGGNPVKWQYSVNDGADWADVTGSEAADGALGTYTVSGLSGGTVYTDEVRVRLVTNVGDGTQSADAKSVTVTQTAVETGMVSDTFDTEIDSEVWTKEGHATASFAEWVTGGYAEMESHANQASGNAYGVNATRLVQDCADVDLQVTIHFDTVTFDQNWQFQGIHVEQDASNFLQVYVERDASGFVAERTQRVAGTNSDHGTTAVTQADSAYQRLTRTGDDWIFETSPDGSAWTERMSFTFALTVAKLGPACAAAGGSTLSTTRVDAFTTAG